MPRAPKWVGDALINILGSKYPIVKVNAVQSLHKELKNIVFEGDFEKMPFEISHAVAFRVSDRDFRNYTISGLDREKGQCEILFHIHGKGPGSDFINRLKVGDSLKMVPPRGKKFYQPESPSHFFFGDETTLGLFQSMAIEIDKRGQYYSGILELQKETIDIHESLGLDMIKIRRDNREPGGNTVECLEDLKGMAPDQFDNGVFYLSGNANAIQLIRKALLTMGINSKNIKTQAYWAEGRIGL
ncbi:siderophore-interacting protein [Pedobacter sp. MC2016-14]|uniref:siderophore-interacting protein n=1 Tax=Pedobacter sp. MC2016-14 TaxID=2897327 RepID=UPI001E445C28|nr:siderophore-interacting protein [Pedobacter sp. MC2016-14]MCD0490507.1 siderophore-interacting protein [Pedobacter sp. MC2016-14]